MSKLECMRTPHCRCQKHDGDEKCWRRSSSTNHHYCLYNTVCSFFSCWRCQFMSMSWTLSIISLEACFAEDSDRVDIFSAVAWRAKECTAHLQRNFAFRDRTQDHDTPSREAIVAVGVVGGKLQSRLMCLLLESDDALSYLARSYLSCC